MYLLESNMSDFFTSVGNLIEAAVAVWNAAGPYGGVLLGGGSVGGYWWYSTRNKTAAPKV